MVRSAGIQNELARSRYVKCHMSNQFLKFKEQHTAVLRPAHLHSTAVVVCMYACMENSVVIEGVCQRAGDYQKF